MTKQLYPLGKEHILNADVDIDTNTIKMRLVNLTTDYTFSAAHEFLSSVTAYAGTTDQTVSSVTKTSGVVDAPGPLTYTAVAISGTKTVGAAILYKDTGVAGTSILLAYWDGADFTSLAGNVITPNGGDIEVDIPTNLFSI